MIKRHLSKYFFLCVCVSILICADISVAAAAAYQSHESIYQAVKKFTSTQLTSGSNNHSSVKIGKLDSRLKLGRCKKSLQAFLPKGGRKLGKTTVAVKCAGTKPWSLHVPVTISVFENVLVATRQLQRGEILSASDVKLEKHDLANLPYGFFESVAMSTGMKLKRRVLEGAVLTPAMLKKPQIISRGQHVTIMARSGRMQVRMDGKALANGAAGERIKVMNLKSKQKLEGVITASGEVKVDI